MGLRMAWSRGGSCTYHLVEKFKGHVPKLVDSIEACNLLGWIIRTMPPELTRFIADEVAGHVRELVGSNAGCDRLCWIISTMPPELTRFIADEIAPDVLRMAKHPRQYLVLTELLDKYSSEDLSHFATAVVEAHPFIEDEIDYPPEQQVILSIFDAIERVAH